MRDIIFIYADGCDACAKMRSVIEKYANKINLIQAEADDDSAVNLAIKYDIDDLPGCNVGGSVFQGENFSSKKLDLALSQYLS
jgi:hypothetical protein